MQIYLVGGAVRDELLNLPVRERDWVVVGGSETQMLAQGFQKVGKDFPVFLHPITKEEYALARTERKTGKGYYGFKCDSSMDVTLEEDLLRRDLTINAMAKTINGEIIDPFNGQLDLQQRVLRHVSPAFAEDPVRILRLARFAAKLAPFGFTVAASTKKLIKTMVATNEVDHLVPERVWQEMARALAEAKPTVFIEVLRECGALKKIFPELDALWGVPQNAKCHPEIDTGVHTMLALDAACLLTTDTKIRFAVLCHDVGKGLTPKSELPNHNRHQELGIPIIKAWCEKYRTPNDYKEFAIQFSRWRMYSHNVYKYTGSEIMQMFNALHAFRNNKTLDAFLIAAASDHRGRLGCAELPYPQAEFLRQAFLAAQSITAKQFANKGLAGPELGQALLQARIKTIDELFMHQKEAN